MIYDKQIKEKVKHLRSKGKTYSEILKNLKIFIPKSTLSYWCNDIILPLWYKNRVDKINIKNFNKAQRMAWASNKLKREKLLRELLENNEYLIEKLKDKDVLKMLLSVLYIAEGSKWKSHHGLMLGNSDPDIIRLYIHLLDLCYGIKLERLKCRISYRTDQDINFLQRYWSRITHIPIKNFYKTKPDPRTLGRSTRKKDYKGVCVIFCGGTDIQLELEAVPKIILKGL